MNTRSTLLLFRFALGLVLLSSLVLGTPSPAYAGGMCFVDAAATGANNGNTWQDAYTDLQSALQAIPCNEIWVAKGTYTPAAGTDRTISFVLRNNVAVYGGFAGMETLQEQRDPVVNPTILSGEIGAAGYSDNSYHVLVGSGTDGTARLDGFIITAGYASGEADRDQYGGGIYISSGSPSLANLIFTENRALFYGGGMYNSAGSGPSLEKVTFSSNFAEDEFGGGGGMLNDASSPSLTGVTFSENWSRYGGGMRNLNGSRPTLTDVTFYSNRSHAGGGMNNNASSPSLTDVAFINNYGYGAGGMNNEAASHPSLVGVTFAGNTATEWGGGMLNYYHSDATLENVTFSSNSAGVSGGGMYNSNSTIYLKDVVFRGNTAALQDTGYGGGMFSYQSPSTLVHVTFQENTAIYDESGGGGGMYNSSGSSHSLTDVTFVGNWAYEGGGMFNTDSSSPSLETAIFRENVGLVRGGGMYNANSSSPDLKDVDFDHNQANFGSGMLNTGGSHPNLLDVTFHGGYGEEGGGMLNVQSSPELVNVTFTDNGVSGGFGRGGAISNRQSNPRLTNVTISGNISDDEGGGGGIYNSQSSPVITNSIVYGNTEGDIVNDASNPLVSYSIVQGGYPGTGNLDADPLLGPLQDNGGFTPTMALGAGSPAIDAGTDFSFCPAADQRGVTRPQGAHCDIGAFEYQQAPPKTMRRLSLAAQDGWILESGEDSGTGGWMNSAAGIFRLGDDARDRQYRSILSFDTSALPDNAVIISAWLRIRRQGLTGTDPFTTHGWLRADIRKGAFSNNAALQLTDFSASASRGAAATFGRLPSSGWYTANLGDGALVYINKAGITQFRLRFSLDDNDDRAADFMQFYSGDAASNRPVLIVTYYIP